jgi:1,4-alpha-glucan branching enzyme
MERLVAQNPDATGGLQDALNQCAREVLLLQSSDWPFLVTTGQARAYAIERFQGHVDRFTQVADLIQGDDIERAVARTKELWEQDKVFPEIDYRWFAERQGKAD